MCFGDCHPYSVSLLVVHFGFRVSFIRVGVIPSGAVLRAERGISRASSPQQVAKCTTTVGQQVFSGRSIRNRAASAKVLPFRKVPHNLKVIRDDMAQSIALSSVFTPV